MKKSFLSLFLASFLVLSSCTSATPSKNSVNGTFTGEGFSMEGSYTVTVEVEDSKIKDVKVDTHFPEGLPEDFQKQGIEAVNHVADEIVSKQSLDVEMISGATVTCQAALDGVYEALDKAGLMKEEDYDVKDGVYEKMIFGNNDMISVSTIIKDKKIEDIIVNFNNETPGVGGELKDAKGDVISYGGQLPMTSIPAQIVQNQSFDVDYVSGATVSSYALITAIKECIQDAGGVAWLYRNPKEEKQVKDQSADVVIVGAGGAGLAAAVRLAQGGKAVILVEKNSYVGGNTLVCGAIYNAPIPRLQEKHEMSEAQRKTVEDALSLTSDDPDKQKILSELQKPVQEQWDAYLENGNHTVFDSKEWYTLQTWIGGDMAGDVQLVKTLCEKSYDGLEWIKKIGVQFYDEIGQGAGSLWQRTHTSTMQMGTGFISSYLKELEKYQDQVTIYTDYQATSLIKEDNRVTGVKATHTKDNQEVRFTAKDGVILATGGFSANAQMVQENNTSGKWPDLSSLPTTNRASAQGDGIQMVIDVGAAVRDMDQIQLLYLGNLENGQLTKYPPRDVNGTDQIIFINKEGKRFVREDGRRDEICLEILKQTDGIFYMLESGDGDLYKDISDPSWKSADGFSFEYLVENGYIFYDETLEGLAKQLEMDPSVLQETVQSFNTYVDGGSDPFGRLLYSTKLENGPWVATPRQVSIHHTMGGVLIDQDCHVLDKDNQPIKGLYAAGEVTGGVHGANRLGGNAVVETVVFGKTAAETILSEIE